MARDDSKALLRLAFMPLLDGGRPSGTRGWVSTVAPVVTQAAAGAGHWAAGRRQRALAEWAGTAGFGLVAWGLGTEAPTGAEALENLAALAGMEGQQRRDLLHKLEAGAPGYRRDGNTRGPPDIAVLPLVRPCFPCSVGGPRRAVAPAPPAAADGARDRQRSPERRLQCPAGGPGSAAAQAEDGRRLSPGGSRIGSPAAGSIG